MRDAGLVTSTHGVTGGYRLAKRAKEIVLLDIILLFEKTMKINRCLEPDGLCKRNEACPMHVYYEELQMTLESFFGRDTLQDVIDYGKNKKRKGMIILEKE